MRLKRLYDAIEAGVADLDDPALKERIAGLKVIRDQARADADRAQALLDSPGHSAITPTMILGFARRARERIRGSEGGYRRDHLRALAQRVEVADDAIRIMGSKTELLRTLIAGQVRQSAATGVPRSGLKWRTGWDSNILRSSRLALGYAVSNVGFRDAASGSRTAGKGAHCGRSTVACSTAAFPAWTPRSGRAACHPK